MKTGDTTLDIFVAEYRATGDIDTFNAACACAYDGRMWDRMGRPAITRRDYAIAPWLAVVKRKIREDEHDRG